MAIMKINPTNSNVGIGTDSPNSNAILELSSTSGALLLPRMTQAQRNNLTAVDGMIIYQTDNTPGIYARVNGSWVQL